MKRKRNADDALRRAERAYRQAPSQATLVRFWREQLRTGQLPEATNEQRHGDFYRFTWALGENGDIRIVCWSPVYPTYGRYVIYQEGREKGSFSQYFHLVRRESVDEAGAAEKIFARWLRELLSKENPQQKGETSDAYLRRLERASLSSPEDAEIAEELEQARQRYMSADTRIDLELAKVLRPIIQKMCKRLQLNDDQIIENTIALVLRTLKAQQETGGEAVAPTVWAYFGDQHTDTVWDYVRDEEVERTLKPRIMLSVYATKYDLQNRRGRSQTESRTIPNKALNTWRWARGFR